MMWSKGKVFLILICCVFTIIQTGQAREFEEMLAGSLGLCAEYLYPPEGIYSACSDQQIDLKITCCDTILGVAETLYIPSDTAIVEFYDSTTSSWQPTVRMDAAPWGDYWVHLDTAVCDWIWSERSPSGSSGDWFRLLIESECQDIDTAFIRIQVDNQGTLYGNGEYIDTTHGNPGSGSTGWRMLHEFDLTEYFHGGVDTLEIMGYNSGGRAGIIFELYVMCSRGCCGNIDPSTIALLVDDEIYYASDPQITWDNESLLTYTPIAPDTFVDGQHVYTELLFAMDSCEWDFDSSYFDVSLEFDIDLSPPVFELFSPLEIVQTSLPDSVVFYIADSLSGLDDSSIEVNIGSGWNAIDDYSSIHRADEIIIYPSLAGILWSPGDSIRIAVRASDLPDLCSQNSDSISFSWFMRDPESPIPYFTAPEPWVYSSCAPESVVLEILDPFGVDGSTIIFSANGEEFDITDSSLIWDEPVLTFISEDGFPSEDTVLFELLHAEDYFGNDISAPIELQFIMDYESPLAEMVVPNIPMVRNLLQEIQIEMTDIYSGVDPSSIVFYLNDEEFESEDLSFDIDGNNISLVFRPDNYGIRYINGDTINVCIELADSPDRCDANENNFCWSFLIEPAYTCGVDPNPVTPNGDMTNDNALFFYPNMFSNEVELTIFNSHKEEVWHSVAPPQTHISMTDGRLWDGKATNGENLRPGLYFYIIKHEGEVICNGSITLVR